MGTLWFSVSMATEALISGWVDIGGEHQAFPVHLCGFS